jgi:hypothetical protein
LKFKNERRQSFQKEKRKQKANNKKETSWWKKGKFVQRNREQNGCNVYIRNCWASSSSVKTTCLAFRRLFLCPAPYNIM